MNDRELLEWAAKAAGITVPKQDPQGWHGVNPKGFGVFYMNCDGTKPEFKWNPLTDDGDTLRLAVKLNMLEEGSKPFIELMWRLATENGKDDLEATRRAIVRAAAEIGKAMP